MSRVNPRSIIRNYKGGFDMAKSKQEIINEIANHFADTSYSDCYIGVTSDVEQRLFVDHNVSKEKGHWIYRTASSSSIAREIEQHFLEQNMDGGTGGGDKYSEIVYVYKKTSYTSP